MATFVVNSTDDAVGGTCDGTHCNLREAITAANNDVTVDRRIVFNLSGVGPHVIRPNSPLPVVTKPVKIDARTQPSYINAPIVALVGNNAGTGMSADGLRLTGGGSTVAGLAIGGFGDHGIQIDTAGGNIIEANYLGLASDGVTPLPNAGDGIRVFFTSDNIIGGPNSVQRNVISGNAMNGVSILGSTASTANNNTVLGNYVGTDYSGMVAIGNQQDGIFLRTAVSNTMIENNLVAGNLDDGVSILETGVIGNFVRGNSIGSNAVGQPLGNADVGILVGLGATGNTIGGTASGEGNIVAHHESAGISIQAGNRNSIRGNSIFENFGIGIDLGPAGSTANDSLDNDTGANDLQNKPVATSATSAGSQLAIAGTLGSKPNQTYTLDFYTSPPNASIGEAVTYQTTVSTTTDGSGNGSFSFSISVSIPLGSWLVATATDINGNTSELSSPIRVEDISGKPFVFVEDAGRFEGNSGNQPLEFEVRLSKPSSSSISVQYATSNTTAQAGSDYIAASGTIVFAPFQSSQRVPVQIAGDSTDEQDESFAFRLTSATNAIILDSEAQGRILDDDQLTSSLPYGADRNNISEYLIGDVYVTVVFVESNGVGESNQEDWTPEEIAWQKSRIVEGLDWWELVFDRLGSQHDLKFEYDFTLADTPLQTDLEFATHIGANDPALVFGELLQHYGVDTPSSNYIDLREFNHQRRLESNSDWAYTIFVLDNSSTRNDLSAVDGGFASAGVIKTSTNFTPATVAHESAHVFYAPDEYPDTFANANTNDYGYHSGYYDTYNLNAYDGRGPGDPAPCDPWTMPTCTARVKSIMAENGTLAFEEQLKPENVGQLFVSPSTLAMMGLQDSDSDGVFDVLDVPLTLSGTGSYDGTTGMLHFLGSSSVQTLDNKNPHNAPRNDITLNRVHKLQYRIGTGAWQDGTIYDTVTANIDVPISVPVDGVLSVKTVSQWNGVESNVLSFVAKVNQAPVLSDIGNQSIDEDTAANAIAFTIDDDETLASSLTVDGSSSNTTLVPNANIVFGGSGTNRTVTITPTANRFGTATITITVSDGLLTASDTFLLTVNAVNDAPTISDIANVAVDEDTATNAISFTIGDVETAATSLMVSGASSNTALVPNANIVFGGSGANRTVTITPATNQSGTATITVTVSDGVLTASDTFLLTVNAVNDAPTISDIANVAVDEDTATNAISFTIGDVETAVTSLMVSGVSSNTALVPSANIVFGGSGANRTVTITPATNQSGTATITVTVGDGVLTASDTFLLTANAVGDTPEVASITTLEDTLSGAIFISRNAADGAEVTHFKISGLTGGMLFQSNGTSPINNGDFISFAQAQSGVKFLPTANSTSAGRFDVESSQTGGTVAAQSGKATSTISITPVDDAPDGIVLSADSLPENIDTSSAVLVGTLAASDADVGDSHTYRLVAGVGDTDNGVFQITGSQLQVRVGTEFDYEVQSSYAIRVATTDAAILTFEQTFAINVTDVNEPPLLASIGKHSVIEGTLLSFDADASDPDAPANMLTYSLDPGVPMGAKIDESSGEFTWTPTEAQGPGTFNITVRVMDNGTPNLNDFETIEVVVGEVNVAPVLASIGNKSVNEGGLLTFTASATDADVPANTLTFSLDAGAPGGASIDANSGVFTWTPSEAQGPGTFNITVRVTDNGSPNLNDVETIEVTVGEVNVAPVLGAIGNKSVDEGSLLTFTASATDVDVPANTLTFSLDAGAPSGANIDANSGVFTWTPSEAQGPGTFNVTVRVTDNGSPNLNDVETIEVTVGEVNVAPVLASIGNKSVSEGNLLTFTASATDVDVPANTLTFSLDAGAPSGANIDANSGVFTWTPSEAQGPGTFNITVRVIDNGAPNLNDVETIEVTVGELNVAPVLASIGNKSVDEGNLLTFTASATDVDVPANTLTFSLDASAPAGAAIDANSGVFAWTPSEAQGPGPFNITVRVTDSGSPNLDDFETIEVTVGEVNVAPVLGAIGNKSVNEGGLLTFTASATDADVPANTLTFSLDAGAPNGTSIDANSGVFTWTPSETQGPGPINITVRVTDNGTPNLNDFETIEVTVGEVNVAPVLAGIGNKSVDEGSLLTFTASATDVDVPANTLTFSLDAGAPSGASIDANSGVFTWTPTEAQGPGTFNITVRVTDNGSPNLNDFETIELTVGEVNVAPVLASIGNKSVDESNLLMFTASASDSDVPANTLTFSLDAGAPSGASIDANSGVFTWTPSEAQGPGIFNIAVRVTDNGPPNLNDVETIEVTVGEVNAAPVLASIGNKSVNEGSQLTFTASATDTDTPTNMLTFSLDAGAPSGASIDATSGVFTWTPSEPQGPGTFSITVRVTDNGTPKFNVMTTFSIEVADPHPWQNFVEPRDVNRDGSISPVDALIVINDLNSKGPRALVGLPLSDSFYIDVNGDGSVSPVDALVVINWLNEPLSSSEGEFIASEMIISGPIVQPRSKLLANPLSSERNATRLPLTTVEPVAVNETSAAGRPPLRLRPFPNAKFFASCELDDLDIEGLLEMISEDIANAIHGG